ncbi:YkgJ family cysteine cluster protein [Pseudodesulfovibrio methanolicus]|uniref:YkgJ family cysteine cluster protein n=1 Tax=Pseudodesulfovibrio methanolicus TaxID=3126690 RepID=A0ABZ2IWY9_9BACT
MTALRPQGEAPDHPVKALHDAVREAYAVCESMLDELQLDPPLACKRGCIHCCYNQVALTEPEALFLGLHLLGTRSPERLRDLANRARALADGLKGKSWREIGMMRHRLPCLFLEDGGCSVYPARPLACRGWNSVDEKMCLRSNLSGDALTPIENHPIVREIADGIQSGLLRGASAFGLEAGYLLMARATALLLSGDPEQGIMDTTADWLDGKPFFGRKAKW